MTDPRPIPGAGAVLYALVALIIAAVVAVVGAIVIIGR